VVLPGEQGPHRLEAGQRRAERLAVPSHGAGHVTQQRLRGGLADERGEFDVEPLRHDRAVGQSQVARHDLGMNLQAAGQFHRRGRGPGGQAQRLPQRLPLGLPRASGTLVLRQQRLGQHGGVGRYLPGRRHDQGRQHRVALLRHRRRRAAAGGGRLGHLADLGTGHPQHVQRDLAEGAGDEAQDRPEIAQRDAQGVPRNDGGSESQFRGERRHEAQGPRRAVVPVAVRVSRVGRSRARSPGELDRKPFRAQHAHPRPALEHQIQPAGRLQPEGDRHRVLGARPAGHQRAAMAGGELGEMTGHRAEIRGDPVEGPPGEHHGGAVEDVLAGAAQVNVLRGLGVDRRYRGRQRLDEADDRVGGVASGPGQRGDIEPLRPDAEDHGHHVLGHHALPGLDPQQRRLDPHHGVEPRLVAEAAAA
jgi:hypothetical protein